MKKQRLYFADKGPFSQSYSFSSSHVWMWELDRDHVTHKAWNIYYLAFHRKGFLTATVVHSLHFGSPFFFFSISPSEFLLFLDIVSLLQTLNHSTWASSVVQDLDHELLAVPILKEDMDVWRSGWLPKAFSIVNMSVFLLVSVVVFWGVLSPVTTVNFLPWPSTWINYFHYTGPCFLPKFLDSYCMSSALLFQNVYMMWWFMISVISKGSRLLRVLWTARRSN